MNPAPCLLLGLAATLPALDQLDAQMTGQWYMPLRDRPVAVASGSWGGEAPAAVRGQDTALARQGGYARASGRVWRDEDSEAWLRLGAAEVREQGDVVLPGGPALPENLADVRVGGFGRRVGASGTILGLDAEVASPSDHPYAAAKLVSVAATAFAFLPTEGRDGWQLGLRYDRTSSFLPNVPLPLVAYQWFRPEQGLRINAGIPFVFAQWRWQDDWAVDAGYFPVDRVQAFVTWAPGTAKSTPGPGGPWAVKAGGAIAYESWMLAGSDDHQERLYYRTVRVSISGEWRPFPGNVLRLTGGRILERDIYLSDAASRPGDVRVTTDPAWYGSVAVNLGF